MNAIHSAVKVALLTWMPAAVLLHPTAIAQPPGPPGKYALLVGCTKYPNCPKLRELVGPQNDVPMLARVLQNQFGFDGSNIRTLVGWGDNPSSRPTYDNIAIAFERLIGEVTTGSQVVVLMSGHGTQVPAGDSEAVSVDGIQPENDGLDEVFLPADVRPWTDGALPGAILDNQFGVWLAALRQKGAHIWIIFDSCHSGTMTRDVGSAEVARAALLEDLGIPESKPLVKEPKGAPTSSERPLELATASEGGSVTEFYAAQSFEEAIELPRPSDGPRTPDRIFGLFCYNLVQALERQGGSLTYADLGNAIVSSYRTERGARGPTPLFAGQLQRQVLGVNVWPPRADILFERNGDECMANAGAIRGISPGSILALLAPAAADAAEETVAYVRAIEVTPGSTKVAPCDFRDKPAIAIKDLPERAYCKIVYRDLGDLRVKLALSDSASDPGLRTLARQSLDELPDDIRALVDTSAPAEKAEWFLEVVTPEESLERYGKSLTRPGAVLVQNLAKSAPRGTADKPKVWVAYDPLAAGESQRVEEFADQLSGDLQKIFTWQNTWRVAESAAPTVGEADLSLEISRLDDSDQVVEVNPANLAAGDRVRILVNNRGLDDWWLTLLYLGPDLEIKALHIDKSIGAGKSFRPLSGRLEGNLGNSGFILLAAPIRKVKIEPSYSALVQTGLGSSERGRAIAILPSNPLARLIAGAGIGKGARGFEVESPEQPQVLLRSWITVPKTSPAK